MLPDDESCDGQWLLSASPFQLDLENAAPAAIGFEYLASSTTIKYCDSPYHIIFTNVKMKSCGSGTRWGWLAVTGHLRGNDMDTLLALLCDWPRKITWLLGALQWGTSTNRPETCPPLSWCRASLTCASERVAVWHRTFPAAPMASTAMRSSRVPTEEAWMRTSSAAI